MLHTTLHHWFFIGLTLHPLAWYSLVHCIGTSHWLLSLIGNSHWILLDSNHHWNKGRTETPTVLYWIGHSLACIIGHWSKSKLNRVHKVNFYVLVNTCACRIHKLVSKIYCVILVPMTSRLRRQQNLTPGFHFIIHLGYTPRQGCLEWSGGCVISRMCYHHPHISNTLLFTEIL